VGRAVWLPSLGASLPRPIAVLSVRLGASKVSLPQIACRLELVLVRTSLAILVVLAAVLAERPARSMILPLIASLSAPSMRLMLGIQVRGPRQIVAP
jgi:hypothetical protein